MEPPRTYAIDELERDTGFSSRTIAYYVQEGLLPRIGRRGPKTRYPKSFRDRIRFIAEIRRLEERGEMPGLTLSQIRDVLDEVPAEQIARIADGRESVKALVLSPGDYGYATRVAEETRPFAAAALPDEPPGLVEEMADFNIDGVEDEDERSGAALHRPSARRRMHRAKRSAVEEIDAMLDLLSQIQREARRERHRGGRFYHSQPWTRVRLSSDLIVFARGYNEDLARLLDRFAGFLRKEITSRGRS